ncbi:MAG: hypothetical protein ACC656_05870, partial [Candidatus Heimdallarchaeota archaeon]
QPPSISPSTGTQPPAAKPKVMDKTKSKIAEIAKRRKKKKLRTPSKKVETDDLFDDLDPLELDEDLNDLR